ncbi:MAG: Tol-Pal system protein TolB [Alphaproteobacteria bacterium]|nr:Tol-Pal system protein TolB [Alphaproteobacteria bacterium]
MTDRVATRLLARAFGSRQAFFGLAVGVVLALGMIGSGAARAELQIDISRGTVEPIPIAITDFHSATGDAADMGKRIAAVVKNDLDRSGLFRSIDQRAFIQRPEEMLDQPRFPDWRQINAQALVTGLVQVEPRGRVVVEFRLWDVFAAQHLVGLRLGIAEDGWRRIGHKIADAIYERLTGESGYFDTRVVYIAESGSPAARKKRLAIMDQDGANFRFLTDGKALVLTPRFSPTTQEITYLSYERGQPHVYLRNIDTGLQELLGNFPGMTFAPRFSSDGNKVVLTYAKNGDSNIYVMDLRTRRVVQVTHDPAIDTSPSFSPDGSSITFESDRGGKQQIYVMNSDGSNVKRISFGKGRYGTPVWSPRGDLIAFTKIEQGQFYIGVIKPDGSDERLIAEGYLVEGPTWAPNGRTLMFFKQTTRDPDSVILVSIDITGRNERVIVTTTAASDPAWSPLIP